MEGEFDHRDSNKTSANSSDDESSEYDSSADAPIQSHDIDLDDDVEVFPREDLSIVMEGLNKWPWTVFPNHLSNCLVFAARVVNSGNEYSSADRKYFQTLYREAVPSLMEKCLDDKAIWSWKEEIHSNIFNCIQKLMNLIVVKLPQLLQENSEPHEDILFLLRTFSLSLDRTCQFHSMHKEHTVGDMDGEWPVRFGNPVPASPNREAKGSWFCTSRKMQVSNADGCDCERCKRPNLYCWVSFLVNYFGHSLYGNGYSTLLNVLNHPFHLSPALLEALLEPIAKILDFITIEFGHNFVEPCKTILHLVEEKLEKDIDSLSDKTRENSFTPLSHILKYLRSILSHDPVHVEEAEACVGQVQRKMIKRMVGFSSFNKQLSAVREINKLLENSKSVSTSDDSQSLKINIEWIEQNNIMHLILRSHLHHKQYVDQVEKIMKFLLNENRLSEEHLNAIWIATEKPDQFEAVKNNIFGLLADLACSFSEDQLDNLFYRFQKSQGRTAADNAKILQLVIKLASNDKNGVLASRLLEFLWNRMRSGNNFFEELDSEAFTKILGHYDSINYASKTFYIQLCLESIKNGEFVISSLKLLKEIIMLDDDLSSLDGQARLQALNSEHHLLSIVISSLEKHMSVSRSFLSECTGQKLNDGDFYPCMDGKYSHAEHVNYCLDFLIWVLQTGNMLLEWNVMERIWEEFILHPPCPSDAEKCFHWLFDILDKDLTLTNETKGKLLSLKFIKLDPSQLSLSAWKCFHHLFLWVNLNEGKLSKPRNDDHTTTIDLNLVGLAYMWQIALTSSVDEIVNASIHSLKEIHTSLSENLQSDIVIIRQKFIDECLQRLMEAIDNLKPSEAENDKETLKTGELTSGIELETSESSKTAAENDESMTVDSSISETKSSPSNDLKQQEEIERENKNEIEIEIERETERETDKENEREKEKEDEKEDEKEKEEEKRKTYSFFDEEGRVKSEILHSCILSLDKEREKKIERCLLLLKVFISKCEGKCCRSIPAHGASFHGRPFKLEVCTVSKQPSRIVLQVHTNEYIYSLLSKVAKQLHTSPKKVRLVYQGKEILHEWQVIRQYNLQPNFPISATFGIMDRQSEVCDENSHPGILISKRNEVFDVIFHLLESSNVNIKEASENLLLLLPTHPGMLSDFQKLTELTNDEEKSQLLSALFSQKSRLLYVLQILDRILTSFELKSLQFRLHFLKAGGFSHLLDIFESNNLFDYLDDRTVRNCYEIGLRLIQFLVLGENHALNMGNDELSSCYIRADGQVVTENDKEDDVEESVVDMGEGENGSIEVRESENAKSIQEKIIIAMEENMHMEKVIFVLMNISWFSSLGKLNILGKISQLLSESENNMQKITSDISNLQLDDEDDGLDKDDVYLCIESFDLLLSCLIKDKDLLKLFFSNESISQFIVDTVLHCNNERTRSVAADFFIKLSMQDIPEPDCFLPYQTILSALLQTKPEVDKLPNQCSSYFALLSNLFTTAKSSHFVEISKKQLCEEYEWLKNAPTAINNKDKLLEGHFIFIRSLILFLIHNDCNFDSVFSGKDLIHLLIKDFLFPESFILQECINANSRHPLHSHDALSLSLPSLPSLTFGYLNEDGEDESFSKAKCKSRGSRMHAFELLKTLSVCEYEYLKEIVDLIVEIHLHNEPINEWEFVPSFSKKSSGGYVGLKNAGATCYMNSVFQQLYMQPQVRKSLLSCDECDEKEKADSVFFQLQVMFGALLGSSLDHYVPTGFWSSYRDYDGLPINLREHQDAFEFFNRLYDSVDENLKSLHHEPNLTDIFGGCFAQQVICRGCPHRSEREEAFAAISVDVKNKKDLIESLDSFVSGDLLEADNAYFCEECGKKVDALKRVCVKTLPHTLVIHLKRFDFDYETMQRLKLKDRFEFPTNLNMKPFTVEGLAMRESKNSPEPPHPHPFLPRPPISDLLPSLSSSLAMDASSSPADMDISISSATQTFTSSPVSEPSVGVRESSDATVSDTKDASEENAECEVGNEDKRRDDSDDRVRESNVREASDQPMGSVAKKLKSDSNAINGGDFEFKNDDYYLYDLVGVVVHSGTAFAGHYYSYVKERGLDKENVSGEGKGERWIAFDDKRVEIYDVRDLEKDCFGGKYTVEVYDNFNKITSPQEFDRPNSAYMLFYERSSPPISNKCIGDDTSMSDANDECIQNNRNVVKLPSSIHRSIWEQNIRFIHESYLINKDYFQFLKDIASANIEYISKKNKDFLAIKDKKGRIESSHVSIYHDAACQDLARTSMMLCVEFLFRIYLHMHVNLRDDMADWKILIKQWIEISPLACQYLNSKILENSHWITTHLIKCPVDDIRHIFSNILSFSLRNSLKFLTSKFISDSGKTQEYFYIDGIVELLISQMDETITVNYHLSDLFLVLYDYARHGSQQRLFLISKRMIYKMLTFFHRLGSPLVNKLDLQSFHSLLSLLIRSTDASSPFLDSRRTESEGVVRDSDNASSSSPSPSPSPSSPAQNPAQVNPMVCRIPSDTFDILLNGQYLQIAMDTYPDSEDVLHLIEFLNFKNEQMTTFILSDICTLMHTCSNSDFKYFTNIILRILQLRDNLQRQRVDAVLVSCRDIFFPGILEMMVQRALPAPKRYGLVKMVTRLCMHYPPARAYVAARLGAWRALVEWMYEELVNSPPPASASSPRTNEDGSFKYLHRTSSAEWTLNNAKNLMASLNNQA